MFGSGDHFQMRLSIVKCVIMGIGKRFKPSQDKETTKKEKIQIRVDVPPGHYHGGSELTDFGIITVALSHHLEFSSNLLFLISMQQFSSFFLPNQHLLLELNVQQRFYRI